MFSGVAFAKKSFCSFIFIGYNTGNVHAQERFALKLEVIDAACGYNKKHSVLKYVNFSLETGKVCCLLGPNGCGKSTLFKSILGLLPLIDGKILIDGEDISSWSASRLATSMAYVSQSHKPPFPYHVEDVVMLGRVNSMGYMGKPSANDKHIVGQAMVDMGVYELKDKPYTEISGGELQLVMIARAVAQQAKIIVLDEPTAALDYGNAMRVIEKVRALAEQGMGVIMTTHNPDHALMCDSDVVLLQKNAPMMFGPATEIITERNLGSAYKVRVKIIEFDSPSGKRMRMCSPAL